MLAAQTAAIEALVEGAPMSAAYNAVVATLQASGCLPALDCHPAANVVALLLPPMLFAFITSSQFCLQDKGQPELVARLPKNVGTAIGLELRDTMQALTATNEKPIKAGMAFNVAIGESGAWMNIYG